MALGLRQESRYCPGASARRPRRRSPRGGQRSPAAPFRRAHRGDDRWRPMGGVTVPPLFTACPEIRREARLDQARQASPQESPKGKIGAGEHLPCDVLFPYSRRGCSPREPSSLPLAQPTPARLPSRPRAARTTPASSHGSP